MQRFSPDELLDTNPKGLSLIRRSESFVGTWYWDSTGKIWTIGYGTTENSMPGVNRKRMPGPISEPEGERLFIRGLISIYEPGIEKYDLELTSNQFSALVSLVYNIGPAAFGRSTLLRRLKAGRYDDAAREFEKWVYSGGKRLRGLVIRRAAERKLFETPDEVVAPVEVSRLIAELVPMAPMKVTTLPFRYRVPNILRNLYDEMTSWRQ